MKENASGEVPGESESKKTDRMFSNISPLNIKDTYDLTQSSRDLATKDCMGNKIQHRPLSKLELQITHFCESNYVLVNGKGQLAMY